MAATATRSLPCAVSISTGTLGSLARIRSSTCMPSMSGMARSVSTTSAPRASNAARPVDPPSQVSTTSPASLSTASSVKRNDASSSMTSTRLMKPSAGARDDRLRLLGADGVGQTRAGLGLHGQRHGRGGADAGHALEVEPSPVLLHQPPGDGDSQPGAGFLGGEVRLADAVEHVGGHPGAPVAHG